MRTRTRGGGQGGGVGQGEGGDFIKEKLEKGLEDCVRSLLEIHILRSHPRFTESEIQGGPRSLWGI